MLTQAQIRRLYAIAKSRGWTYEGVKQLLEKTSKDLTPEQYDEVCVFLETANAPDTVTMKRDTNPFE